MTRCLFLAACLLGGMLPALQAQRITPTKNKEQIFETPEDRIRVKLRRTSMSQEEHYGHMWTLRRDTDADDAAIRRNVLESAEGPFRSRYSVWASQTMTRRAAEFGGGELSYEARATLTPADRAIALEQPEPQYFDKAEQQAMLAAVYRYLFTYRSRGFAPDTTVYFVGFGPHLADAPPSLLAALESDATLERDKVRIRPLSKLLEVTNEAIRDRDTGAYGAAFRVDAVSAPDAQGDVTVLVAFNERDGLWFSRDLTLRPGPQGWTVVADNDHVIP